MPEGEAAHHGHGRPARLTLEEAGRRDLEDHQMLRTLLAGAAGAALAYLLDPGRGRRRRNMTRDRVAALVRRGSGRLERAGRAAAAEAYGVTQKAAHSMSAGEPPPNDETLARKVESELFRDPDIPKGQINVHVEHGVVVLRGELDRPEQINAVEAATRKIPGVLDVENLLHLPGTPHPTSEALARRPERERRARA